MTKLNWERARQRDRDWAPYERQLSRPKKPPAFPARFAGKCANCHAAFPIGALVRFNVESEIVHGRGCPKKPKQESRLAG